MLNYCGSEKEKPEEPKAKPNTAEQNKAIDKGIKELDDMKNNKKTETPPDKDIKEPAKEEPKVIGINVATKNIEKIKGVQNLRIVLEAPNFLGQEKLPKTCNVDKTSKKDGDVKKDIDYTYDDTGKIVNILEQESTGKKTETKYNYDKDGKLMSYSESNNSGISTIDYGYDENNTLKTENAEYNYNGITGKSKTDYTYNDKGLVVNKLAKFDYSGRTATNDTNYKYNDKGQLVSLESKYSFKGGFKRTTTEFEYNDDAKITKETKTVETDKGKTETTTTYEYDKDGKILTISKIGDDGKEIISYEY